MWKIFWRRVVLSRSLLSALWRENLILGEHAIRVWDTGDPITFTMTVYHEGKEARFVTGMFCSPETDDPMYGYVDVLVADDEGTVHTPLRHKRLYGTVHWNYGEEKP